MTGPTAPAMLEPDRAELAIFIETLFRHADKRGFASLRGFYENGGKKPFRITPISLVGGLGFLTDAALDDARRAAQTPKPVVFAPPIAVFTNEERATEKDLLEGLTLSVECDARPQQARAILENLLGPATVVVRSGGVWTDPEGAAQNKLHLHWRLAQPARGANLARLKALRALAARLAGGDPSNMPIVHPIRWAGSWWRKCDPAKLCAIEAIDADREIDLDPALAILGAALDASQGQGGRRADAPGAPPPELKPGRSAGNGRRPSRSSSPAPNIIRPSSHSRRAMQPGARLSRSPTIRCAACS